MTYTDIIPHNFQDWKHCITVKCGIELTPDFVIQRLANMENKESAANRDFIKLYGEEHFNQVREWFQQLP